MATFSFTIFLAALSLTCVVGDNEARPEIPSSFQASFKKTEDLKEVTYGLLLYDENENTFVMHYDEGTGSNIVNTSEVDEGLGSNIVIVNYTSEEVLIIDFYKTCTVEKQDKDLDYLVFPFPSTNTRNGTKMDTNDILHFDPIDCQEESGDYVTCTGIDTIKIMDQQLNCTFQHCFSKPDDKRKHWTLQRIIITCENPTTGIQQMIFEFYKFQGEVTTPEELQQPLGVFCNGRRSSKQPPALPDRFRLTLETIDSTPAGTIINSEEVWYDGDYRIIIDEDRMNWGKNGKRFVRDYRRGIQYSINTLTKSCTISNITPRTGTEFGEEKTIPTKESYFWFKNVQYIGEKISDGIAYDVWATINSDIEMSTVRNIFYIKLLSMASDGKEIVRVPVKKVDYYYTRGKLESYQYTRILHYELQPVDWSILDLTDCFETPGVQFELTMYGPKMSFEDIPVFQETVHNEVMEYSELGAVLGATRISNFQLHHIPTNGEGELTVTGVITEDPFSLGFGNKINDSQSTAEEAYLSLEKKVNINDFSFPIISTNHPEKQNYSATKIRRLIREERNACDPNPCRNDGTCSNTITSFSCECEFPWKGIMCTEYSITPAEPEIPPSFQAQFTMYFYSNIYHGSLLYDDSQKIMAIHFQEGEEKNYYIYKIVTSEELIITGYKCETKKVDGGVISIFPFAAKSIRHPTLQRGPKSRSILLFDGSNKTFIGEEKDVFGRKFHKWGSRKEIIIDEQETKCDLTHWFVVDDDNTTSLEAISLKCMVPGSTEDFLKILFHLSQFAYDVKNQADVQQPSGIYCKSESTDVTEPQLPDRFRLSGDTFESIIGSGAIGSSFEYWYDTESQLFRKDQKISWNAGHTVTISEYKRGLSYYIKVYDDECEIQNLTEKVFPSKNHVLQIDDDPDVQTPQFVGQRLVNDIKHNIWTYASKDMTTVTEITYVMEAATDSQQAVPVKIERFDHNEKTRTSYRILDFSLNPADWSIFDLTQCFKAKQKIPFQLLIEGSKIVSLSSMPTFTETVHQHLLKHLKVSPSRVSKFQISHLGGGLSMVSGVLTEDPRLLGYGNGNSEDSAEQALQNLGDSVRNKVFTFKITSPEPEKEEIIFNGSNVKRLIPASVKQQSSDSETDVEPEPEIPPSFQMEFTVYFFRNIYHGSLLYDDSQKTMAIHFQEEEQKSFYIYNFDSNEELIIKGWKCEAKRVDSGIISIFPFAAKSLHHQTTEGVSNSQSILLFDGENKAFVGQEVDAFERTFHKWNSTKEIIIDQQQMNCDLTHWFIVNEDGTSNLEAINLKCVLPESTSSENTIDILLHLSQFAYVVKNQGDLQQPSGTYCKNKTTTGLTPPQFPDRFRIKGDTLFAGFFGVAISSSFEFWYDTESQLLRTDQKLAFNSVHEVTISDFKRGVRYLVKVDSNQCNIQNMTETDIGMPLQLLLLLHFTAADEIQTPQFVGQRVINGIPHDIWSYTSDDMAHIAEISYVMEADDISTQANVPVKVHIFDHYQKEDFVFRMYSYSLNPSDWSIFDLTDCYKDEQKIHFQLMLEGSKITSFLSAPTFTETIHQQLLKSLNVSPTRVSNFQIYNLEGVAMVSGVLTEDPTLLGYKTRGTEPSAEQAWQNLIDSVKNKEFTFKIKGTEEENEISFTGKTVERLTAHSTRQVYSGYGSGSMAALGVCMLIIGGLFGTAALVIYNKYKQSGGFQRQANDGL